MSSHSEALDVVKPYAMPKAKSSSSRRHGKVKAATRYRSTPSGSNGSCSSNTRPSSHWQNQPRQQRVIIDPRPSFEPPSNPRSVTPHPGTAIGRSDEAEELLDHIIMAVDVKEMGDIGCAYYIAREERLLCMEDVPRGGIESIERLKTDLQPTIVLLSLRVDGLLESQDASRLRKHVSLINNDEDNAPLPYNVELRPSPEFSYEGAVTKLVNLHNVFSSAGVSFLVPGDNLDREEGFHADELGLTNRQGRLLQISAWLDLDNKVSISCVGAVISYLQRKRASEYLPDDAAAHLAYRIMRIEMFTFKDTMVVNSDTLLSLQIIQPESHPNAFNQGPGTTGSKESLSVFGLFQHSAKTPQGKARLRQNFLRPSTNVEVINSRLEFVSVFVRPDNQPMLNKLSDNLNKIKNMRNVMTMLQKGVDGDNGKRGNFKGGVWASLIEFCYHAIDIVEGLREVAGADTLDLYTRAADILDRFGLQRIGKMVHDIVDLESSTEEHRTVVKRGIHHDLDKLKDIYDGMDDLLHRTALEIGRSMPTYLIDTLNIIYFPQLGFHITVPLDGRTGQALWSGGEQGWQPMFTTANQVYFKDPKMREMDQDLGDLWASICDIEIELAHDLAQRTLIDREFLIAASDFCGELDSLLALAHGAVQCKLVRPRIVEENIIDIKGGRHVLQEMMVPSYVPNDTFLVGGSGISSVHEENAKTYQGREVPSMLMLTGPNYSGKSVYQKQVALIVYMGQLGSFVPAEACTIGITDKILTRIMTRETVSKAESAFMIDIQQVTIALNLCTRKSLIIIDEFGKGTDTCDGAGLAAGAFKYLLDLGEDCPKVLAATHFHEIFDLGLFGNTPRIAHSHLEVHVERNRNGQVGTVGNDDTEVTYLYNLRQGRTTLSYGAQCASINGVPQPIVSRASQLAEHMSRGEDLVAICSALSSHEMEDLADAEAVSRTFLEQDFQTSFDAQSLVQTLDDIINAASSPEGTKT